MLNEQDLKPCVFFNRDNSCDKPFIHNETEDTSNIHSCALCYYTLSGLVNVHTISKCPLLCYVNQIEYKQKLLSSSIFNQVMHSMMRWNLTSKKTTTETEYEVWKLLSCSFTYHSKKNPFPQPRWEKSRNLAFESEITEQTNFFNNK